jgi:hypothetical protein
MAAWLYSLHPPREDFAATMTDDEVAAWNLHFKWLGGLLEEGRLVLAGVTLGAVNTGMALFEAADEAAARGIVSEDPPPGAASPGASCAPSTSDSCAGVTGDGDGDAHD